MKISKIESKILKELYKSSGGLFQFTIYNRFKFSISELLTNVNSLVKKELVISKDDKLILSEKGIRYVTENKLVGEVLKSKNYKIPIDFLAKRIEINEFYLPDAKKFTKHFIE